MQQPIYTVSQLTNRIKDLLEEKFPFIWVSGEVANFSRPSSGHYYFTLKDQNARISGVMFRGQNRNLKFIPEDGMEITGLGRLTVYQPRGAYQIIFEHLEPKGVGALQVAFDRLKRELAEEGLFKKEHKKPLPSLPRKVSVITSPTGAVLHDIMDVIHRRYPNMDIRIFPVSVQGGAAEGEIVAALKRVNTFEDSDVAILARGGGSLEDLMAFNSEKVARAIFGSKIPVVSAVGHETDVTIADFVADLRAPTPSAAAELVVPLKRDLRERVAGLDRLLTKTFLSFLDGERRHVDEMRKRLRDPKRRVEDLRLRLDDYQARLLRVFSNRLEREREHLSWHREGLYRNSPRKRAALLKERLAQQEKNLIAGFNALLERRSSNYRDLATRLTALDPMGALSRGYSITRTVPEKAVVTDSESVNKGDTVEIKLFKGSLICSVEGKEKDGQTDL